MEFCEWGILGRSPGPPNGNWYPKWLPRRLGPPPLLFSQLVSAGSKGGQRGAAAVLAVPSPGQAVSSAPPPPRRSGHLPGRLRPGSERRRRGLLLLLFAPAPSLVPAALETGTGSRGEGGRKGEPGRRGGEGAAWGRGRSKAGVLARWVLEPGSGYNEHLL